MKRIKITLNSKVIMKININMRKILSQILCLLKTNKLIMTIKNKNKISGHITIFKRDPNP